MFSIIPLAGLSGDEAQPLTPRLNRRTWPTCLDIWGPPGSVVGTFCRRACCSSAEMAAASHSELSDSRAQVLPENEKTKRIECQSN